MAEPTITYRIPSKEVPYGYVELTGDPGWISSLDFEEIGREYLHANAKFLTGEAQARKGGPVKLQAAPEVDTSLAEHNLRNQPMAEPTQEEAQEMISEGLDEKAPWEETVTAAPKPWEKKEVATVKAPTKKFDLL